MSLKYGLVAAAILASSVIADSAHNVAADTAKATVAHRSRWVSTIASRRFWWRNGERHVRSHREPRVYGIRAEGDYYEHDASKLPFGSQRWREQMRRENRLGNPG